MTQRKLYGRVVARTCLCFVGLCWSVALLSKKEAAPSFAVAIFAVAIVWLSSIVVMDEYRRRFEQPDAPKLFDLRRGSWACLIGDTLVLPVGVVFALLGWRAADFSVWSHSVWWWLVAFVVGVFAGGVFHTFDGKYYKSYGATAALGAPTKLAHDFIAYPVLFGAFVFLATPMFINWSWQASLVAACLLLWLFLGLCDIIRELNPRDLHPAWDSVQFRSKPW